MGFKHTDLSKFKMANTWDKVLEYNQQSSEYYAIMVQKFGKALADYYWNRRFNFEGERDYEWRDICKDINEKCDLFLKSRGIILDYNGESKSRGTIE